MQPDPHHLPRHHAATFALTLALAAALAYLIALPLGRFLAGLTLAILLVPYAVAAARSAASALLAAACVTDAVAAVWLVAVWADPAVHLRAWLAAYGVLLAVALLEFALLPLLRRIGLSRPSAAGLVALAALLWLAAPIWLLPHLQSPALLPWMQRLIAIHPVFAINSAIPVPIWTESSIAYTLLNLNQDVPYSLPSSVLPAIIVHAALGLLLCLTWIKDPDRAGW